MSVPHRGTELRQGSVMEAHTLIAATLALHHIAQGIQYPSCPTDC